ncbi:MAG: MarR family EPS-associated transcriptional regulator, partial [Candidatus Omnitrophica bacterium]|nr:MarR family EPS-associated transcriptional regulator [Candidatus Omnitrophota bacterium]
MIEQPQKPQDNSNSEDALFILKELSSNSQLTQRDLSQKIGISLGKTNYIIRELAKKGLLKIINFSHKDQKLKRISYILTPQGLKEKIDLTLHFLQAKQQEYEDLKREWE